MGGEARFNGRLDVGFEVFLADASGSYTLKLSPCNSQIKILNPKPFSFFKLNTQRACGLRISVPVWTSSLLAVG